MQDAAAQSVRGYYNAAVDFVDRNVSEGRGHKTAFVDPAGTLTYADLQEHTQRFAAVLRRLGIGPERRIVLIMLDTIAFPIVFWGAIRAGVVPVPANTLLPPEQLGYILDDSRAEAVVISAPLFESLAPILAENDRLRSVIVADLHGPSRTPPPRPRGLLARLLVEGETAPEPPSIHEELTDLLAQTIPDANVAPTCEDEVAFWLYSSGSTGAPKGVKHVHASPRHTVQLYGEGVLGLREDDVIFSAAKLFFAYGLGNALSFPMAAGATTILLPDRPTPSHVLALMEAHQPTVFFGVPTLFSALLAHDDIRRRLGSERLRMCVSAGEALPTSLAERWREVVGVDILDGIGSTEMLHIFVSNRPGDIRDGSSGKPVPGYEARIVDDHGRDVPDGEIGELIVRGPSAAEGYWNQRAKSQRTFAGEWTYTGDKYTRDPDGYYHYCGRTDDMFKVSGIWVSPFEVEAALLGHAAILEAAVVGQEDADGLTKPRAFVVLKTGVPASEGLLEALRGHVKAVAGPWKYPRWIDVVDELPKTATGKIQRFKLRAEPAPIDTGRETAE